MWEALIKRPRGRISARRLLLLVATFLVVSIGGSFALSHAAYAATATWKDGELTYNGNTYKGPINTTNANGLQIPNGAQVYRNIQTVSGTSVARIIYFEPGVVPKSAKEATYVVYTLNPPNDYSNPTGKTTLTNIDTSEFDTPEGVTEGTSSCQVSDNVGWFVCGVGNWISDNVDAVYGIIASFLKVQPITGGNNSIYRLWDVVRDIANALFIIGFLIIIYRYMTDNVADNYVVRRILPRIVIAAILVNISYWITALAVDVSNILGASIQSLFEAIRQTAVGTEVNVDVTWKELTAYVFSGGTIAFLGFTAATGAAGSVLSLAFTLLGVLIGVAFAALVALIVLAARQALIVIFVIISPLAFAANILPNTEDWFDKWRKAFVTLLLVFPIFSMIFGGSQLASAIIIQSAANVEGDGSSALAIMLLGMAVKVVPLVITPLLIQFSGSLVGRIAGIANNANKGLVDGAKNWANSKAEYHRDKNLRQPNNGINNLNFARRTAQRRYARDLARKKQQETWQKEAENMAHGRRFEDGALTKRAPDWYRNRQARSSYDAVDQRYRDAELEHRRHDAHNKERWVKDAQTGANMDRRRAMTDAHLSEGRGKLYEEAMTNADESALQTQIATGALRNVKIRSDVDAAKAGLTKSNMEAEGKKVFRDEVKASPGLSNMQIQTYEFEKRAEVAEGIVQKQAESNWNRISKTDGALRNLRLQEVQASDQASFAEAEWNSLIEGIRAKGTAAPDISAADRALAGSIQALTQDIEIENQKQTSAKVIQQENMTSRFKTDIRARERAGGVAGDRGANRVYAKAKSDTLSALMEGITNSRSVISEYSAEELVTLQQKGIDRDGNTNVNEEMRMAAMYELGEKKGNNWAFQKMRDWVALEGMVYEKTGRQNANGQDIYGYFEPKRDADGKLELAPNGKPQADMTRAITDEDEIELRRDRQQLFYDMQGKSKHYIASLSGTDRGEYDTGLAVYDSSTATIRDIRDDKFNGERLVKTDIDEYSRMVHILSDQEELDRVIPDRARQADAKKKLLKHIRATQSDKNMYGRLEGRQRALMNVMSAILDPTDTRPLAEKKSEYRQIVDPNDANNTITVPYAQWGDHPEAEVVNVTTYIPDDYTLDKIVG